MKNVIAQTSYLHQRAMEAGEKKQVGSYAVKNHHVCSAVLCPYMATAKNNQSITLNNSNWWTSYSSPVSIIKGCYEFRSAFSCGNDQSAFQRHYIIEQQALSLFTHFFSDVCLVSCSFTQQWHIQQKMSVVYDPPAHADMRRTKTEVHQSVGPGFSPLCAAFPQAA